MSSLMAIVVSFWSSVPRSRLFFFFQAEDGIRDIGVTGVQTCALPILPLPAEEKQQLLLLGREWYMHPNGQLPAYEWNFGDVNPPVQAWAALRVFEIDRLARQAAGDPRGPDVGFLERVFHKMLLNFTWWVNRKDATGRNLFEGGFL